MLVAQRRAAITRMFCPERTGLLVELRDYVRALRRSWPLLVVCVMLGALVAAAATWREAKAYAAAETLVVVSSDGTDSATSAYQGGLLSQQRVKSYVDLVASDRIAAGAVARLGLDMPSRSLQAKIKAEAVPDTVLLRITVTDGDARRAQALADAVGEVFSEAVAQIETPAPDKLPSVRVNVWEKAKLPTEPVSPKPVRAISLGALLGLLVSIGAAVLRQRLDTSVRTDADITAATGLATLGAIAFDTAGARYPLVGPLDAQSARAEAFRQLRTNLRFADVDMPARVILVSSATSAEGKTTTTCNLAIILAQAGARVALVEADLRRPSFREYLGIETAAGLTSVLIGAVDLDDVLLPWGDDGGRLEVLPSGPLPPNPSELLGSRGMGEVLRELSGHFDIVLIDAPPLLPVTDAAVLAAQVDGTLLVVRNGRTRREQLARAAEVLRAVDARVLGVVHNMIPTKGLDAMYYGYPSYSGYTQIRMGPGRRNRHRAVAQQSVVDPGRSGAGHSEGRGEGIRIATQRESTDDPDGAAGGPADDAAESRTMEHPVGGVGAGGDLSAELTTPLALDAKTTGSHRRKR